MARFPAGPACLLVHLRRRNNYEEMVWYVGCANLEAFAPGAGDVIAREALDGMSSLAAHAFSPFVPADARVVAWPQGVQALDTVDFFYADDAFLGLIAHAFLRHAGLAARSNRNTLGCN